MEKKLHLVSKVYLFIFIAWGLYRLIFRFPQDIEEIILKPLIWLIPTFYIVFKFEKKGLSSLGYSVNNFGADISKGFLFGLLFLIFGLSLNFLRNGNFSYSNLPIGEVFFPALILSFITAIIEETVFRGYIMNRLAEAIKSWGAANIISSIGFCLIHLPIAFFVYHYDLPQLFIYLTLIFLTSLGSGLMFSWTKTIWSPILIHVFWVWPIVLLR